MYVLVHHQVTLIMNILNDEVVTQLEPANVRDADAIGGRSRCASLLASRFRRVAVV
jgi:hypothetical protein